MLRQGEQEIFREEVKLLALGTVVGGGTLILTNTRIIYEKKDVASLFGGGKVNTEMDCVLSDIRNLSQGRVNVVSIETNYKNYEFSVQDPNWWHQAIKNTMDVFV